MKIDSNVPLLNGKLIHHASLNDSVSHIVDTEERENRLDLLHDNVKKYSTVFNTVASGTLLSGVLYRKTGDT